MRKKIFCWVLVCALLFVLSLGVRWFFHKTFLKTSDTLSLSYVPSATNYWRRNYFYVHDNVLYFVEHGPDIKDIVKYVKNDVIHTYAKIPSGYDRFIIIDDKSALIQWKDIVHLLNVADDSLVELWEGECVGYYDGLVYFTKDNMLYSAKISETEPKAIISFDDLLASDYNGITYQKGENIYQFVLSQPNEPKLLTTGDIPWPESRDGWLPINPYLFTSEYALHIGDSALYMYVYKTGEMKRIFEVKEWCCAMAVVAHKDELYVSRQCTDSKFWPVRNKQINGTYKYDIIENTWTRISKETYSVLVQFDEHNLYGHHNRTSFFPGPTRINIG